MVDWDLAAPGLDRDFAKYLKDTFGNCDHPDQALDSQAGLMGLFVELDSAVPSANSPHLPLVEESAHDAFDSVQLERFIVQTDVPSLSLLKAGKFEAEYGFKANTFP